MIHCYFPAYGGIIKKPFIVEHTKDSITIANYGIDYWYKLQSYDEKDTRYEQIRLLSRQYNQYISMLVKCRLGLLNLLEQTMPQITTLLENDSQDIKRDKLNGFVKKYWHYDNITKFSQQQFITNYNQWAKRRNIVLSKQRLKNICIGLIAKSLLYPLKIYRPKC
jgi:transposase